MPNQREAPTPTPTATVHSGQTPSIFATKNIIKIKVADTNKIIFINTPLKQVYTKAKSKVYKTNKTIAFLGVILIDFEVGMEIKMEGTMKYLKIAVLLLAFIPLGHIFAQETAEEKLIQVDDTNFKLKADTPSTPYLPM